jgi:hypothetical protein
LARLEPSPEKEQWMLKPAASRACSICASDSPGGWLMEAEWERMETETE